MFLNYLTFPIEWLKLATWAVLPLNIIEVMSSKTICVTAIREHFSRTRDSLIVTPGNFKVFHLNFNKSRKSNWTSFGNCSFILHTQMWRSINLFFKNNYRPVKKINVLEFWAVFRKPGNPWRYKHQLAKKNAFLGTTRCGFFFILCLKPSVSSQ